MRFATSLDTDKAIDDVVAAAQAARDAGFSAVWSSQIFGVDALTVLAIVGREVEGIEIATGVVPIHPRHPMVLAAQALTVQAISKGRLTLGIGLSHKVMVEGVWGISFDKPGTYMREYLDALVPMLHAEPVNVQGTLVKANVFQKVGPAASSPPSLVVAALGPEMLRLAGTVTDGTVTWMTGIDTLRDYVVPTIRAAAEAAGRPSPRVIASVAVCLTDDVRGAAARIDEQLAIYPTLPSYKAMLDREGVTTASGVSIIGSRDRIEDALGAHADAGVTEVLVAPSGSRDEVAATFALLGELASKG
jgi:5,10-methylenetetrahydromethanopterin reductase